MSSWKAGGGGKAGWRRCGGKASGVGRERLERKESDSWGTAGGGRGEAVTGSHLYVSRDNSAHALFHARRTRQRWKSVALRERACPRNTSGGAVSVSHRRTHVAIRAVPRLHRIAFTGTKRARPRGVAAPAGAAFSPASTSSDALATAASLVVASAAPPQAVVHASDEPNARRARA